MQQQLRCRRRDSERAEFLGGVHLQLSDSDSVCHGAYAGGGHLGRQVSIELDGDFHGEQLSVGICVIEGLETASIIVSHKYRRKMYGLRLVRSDGFDPQSTKFEYRNPPVSPGQAKQYRMTKIPRPMPGQMRMFKTV